VIRSVSPDVAALQEVDRKTSRSGGVDQAQQLACLTGMELIDRRQLEFPADDN
jgi:endonuclease/exonuclease/phosphatase family metal-dependent hydrolase